jgi:hypothetical protein
MVMLGPNYEEFVGILNPFIRYGALKALFYEQLKSYWIADKSSQDEVMFIAH